MDSNAVKSSNPAFERFISIMQIARAQMAAMLMRDSSFFALNRLFWWRALLVLYPSKVKWNILTICGTYSRSICCFPVESARRFFLLCSIEFNSCGAQTDNGIETRWIRLTDLIFLIRLSCEVGLKISCYDINQKDFNNLKSFFAAFSRVLIWKFSWALLSFLSRLVDTRRSLDSFQFKPPECQQ